MFRANSSAPPAKRPNQGVMMPIFRLNMDERLAGIHGFCAMMP
jgi:hypothetical protein